MKKHLTFSLLASISLLGASAQDIKFLKDNGNGMALQNTAPAFIKQDKLVNGATYQDFGNTAKVFTMTKGAPALPVHSESVIVPDAGNVTIVVTYDSFEEFDNISVLPSKGSLKRNITPSAVPYEFGGTYSQDAFYPGNLAEMSSPFILRGTRGVTVSFFPYQYNPVTKKLRLYHGIRASFVVNAGEQGINEISGGKGAGNSLFNQVYRNLFANAEAMYEPVSENGEMLVIVPDNYAETVAPLVAWKNKKGIKTTVATLSQTGAAAENIKSFIQGFYDNNPGLAYILFAGDHEDLPTYSYGITGAGEELWSDTYYAQLEGDDFYPEVLVGRFSGNIGEVAVMVNRTLEYEMNPMQGNWMTRAVGIGSNEGDGFGDDGEPDWLHNRNMGIRLLDNGYTYIHELFDGSHGGNDQDGNVEPYMISEAVNDGVGLINYTGHGAQDVMVTGWYTNDHVNMLENNGMYPFVISVACNNGTFAAGTSHCEAWLRVQHNNMPAGAIAAAGSSILMAWAEPMQTQDEMTELVVGGEPGNDKNTLGGLFYNGQYSMLESYWESPTAVEVMQTWVLFGDPSVVFRTAEASQLVATHPATVQSTAGEIIVQCAVEGAVVAITQNGIIIGTAVVSGGQAVISLGDFEGEGLLDVTVTQQNFVPYQGTITMEALGRKSFESDMMTLYPNPATDYIIVKMGDASAKATFEVRDITGRVVHVSAPGNGNPTIDTSGYASGIYLLTATSNGAKSTKQFVVK
ncbi:C25 family cysteine peptidase [Flavobacterium sp. MFBS3-15]|uniref:C25 family cysteine peptidase n=1 Tax=Flavobacterium sp. MFBS3-15 TaxID=2989816 RepID=UPI0022354BA8|nr:C25 family cysteine peptidase [Flavobacterium sp. MFBS3-15]MCW4469023.1 C25 family cysteine peptidase [Flavobacterium sp. MFBS3-15]